jgi:hypothetical protein
MRETGTGGKPVPSGGRQALVRYSGSIFASRMALAHLAVSIFVR